MKPIRIILPLLFLACVQLHANERTIDRPPFINWSSGTIEIDQIILSDTATVFNIKAFFRPKNWIQIAPESFLTDDKGQQYAIRAGDGITLGEKFWMPDSGEAGFRLIFPPLPDGVKYVDFSEGDNMEGAFKIWGIQLDGKLPALDLPTEISTAADVNKMTVLPQPEIYSGTSTLTGKILDYRPGMDSKMYIYVMHNVGDAEEMEVPIEKDGSFSMQIPTYSVTPCMLILNSRQIGDFFLCQEQETRLYINSREITRSQSRLRKDQEKSYGYQLYYSGFMGGISAELVDSPVKTSFEDNYMKIMQGIADKSIPEIKDYVIEERQNTNREIEALDISTAARQILKLRADFLAVNILSDIKGYYQRAYLIKNNIRDRDESMKYMQQPVDVPESVYNELARFRDFNLPVALYCDYYGGLTSNSELAERYAKAIGTDKGTFFDLNKVNTLLRKIDEFKPATSEELLAIQEIDPLYYQIANEKNDKLLATIEANKKKTGFRINEAGQVSNEDLFASLIAPFSGKTILVDFWATWCGPCRMANKEMAPMKEELKDKDIVYLYIAGTNSPEGTWNNMITDIPGEHYRLTSEQWEYLRKEFKVEGVPTYLIINKKGEMSFRTVGYPGVTKMKEEIEKAL